MCVWGGGLSISVWGTFEQLQHSFSSASLVLVTYIRLPETRSKDIVSMHECYTEYLLFMFSMVCKLSLFAPLMTSKGVGESRLAVREHRKPCSSVAEFFKFFGKDMLSGQRVQQMCKSDTRVAA